MVYRKVEKMKVNSYPREVRRVYKNKGELEIKLIEVTDLLNKKYAYWERLKVPGVVNQALRVFFRNKKINKKTMFAQKEVNLGNKIIRQI